jgi:hypothetical protein
MLSAAHELAARDALPRRVPVVLQVELAPERAQAVH